jgi:TRAP-type C4-dicarboxylate transport system permease small subunit
LPRRPASPNGAFAPARITHLTEPTVTAESTSNDHVLDAAGHFHTADQAIDLSVYGWEDWLTLAFFWALALVVFYQFFTRYVLGDSAAWTEEIARYLLIVICFVGASMAVRRNTHIHVEFLYRYLPAKVGRVLSTCVDVVRVAFLCYAVWLTFLLIPKVAHMKMTVVDFPLYYMYGLVAFGFAMMTFRAVQVAIRHWRQGWSVLERPGETEA